MKLKIRRPEPTDVQFSRRLIEVQVGLGIPGVDALHDEFLGYTDVLLGRAPSPVDSPYLALAEVATAYHARALEVEMLIHEGERDGAIVRGSPLYRFRTGALRSFIELSKKLAELGSRRLTQEQVLAQQRLEAPGMP